MDIHDLHNVIDSPTCFKSENKSLLDIILTSNKRRVAHTLNVNTGISDFHNLIAFSIKIQIPKTGNKYIQYRSYKKFDEACLNMISQTRRIMLETSSMTLTTFIGITTC